MDIREFLKIDSSRLNADESIPVIWLFAIKHPYYVEPRLSEIIRIFPDRVKNLPTRMDPTG